MRLTILLLLTLTTTFFWGCRKSEIHPNAQEEDMLLVSSVNKTVNVGDLKVAERINGLLICTVDEDILKEAIGDYYGGSLKRMKVREFKPNSPNNFYAIKGRVRNGNLITRYAFELIHQGLPNGDVELYLPVSGTEQRVIGPKGATCKLKLTSASTGYAAPAGQFCFGFYSSSTSSVNGDTHGTNGLILQILNLLP